MTDKMAHWIDRRLSRRGMLAKTGGAIVGVGTTLFASRVGDAFAAPPPPQPFCCQGVQCSDSGFNKICPGTIGACPSGCTNGTCANHGGGHEWTCCYGGRTAYCWECNCPYEGGPLTPCYCNSLSGEICPPV